MDVHVVSHTHWDREWYHGAGRFRQRLVALIDDLLDRTAAEGIPFLLDGQAILIEDYLAVRPEREATLSAALRDGQLEAGPWYVLADELLPGGESLVRNLLAGRAVLDRLGSEAPPVLYSPDAFGHPAALPLLAAGFGLPLVIVWRGYGGAAWPGGDTARWSAADGTSVLLAHLPPQGYEAGSSLPADDAAASARWRQLRAVLAPRARTGVVLLLNGADHHALQPQASEAIAALARAAAPGARVVHSTLSRFAAALAPSASNPALPTIAGELRDSYGYAWTLQGTTGTRTPQKRRAAIAERLLLHDVEPWVALAPLGRRPATRASLGAAWRTLLRCHPHDTLCGCSVDMVARAMDARLEAACEQAVGLRADALESLVGHDPGAARDRSSGWQSTIVVRNRTARPRGGVADVQLLAFVADEPVGPGSADAIRRTAPIRTPRLDGGAIRIQRLAVSLVRDRVESPRHYPDNDLVLRTRAVAWVPPVSGWGTWSAGLDEREARARELPGPRHPVRSASDVLDNGLLRVAVGGDGRVRLESLGHVVDDLLDFEHQGDIGDCYTPSLVGRVRAGFRPQRVRRLARGPLRGILELRYMLQLPGACSRESGSHRRVRCPVVVRLSLDADAPFLRVAIRGENRARDHRLRVLVRTGVPSVDCWADAAFGPVRRPPPPSAVDAKELPLATAPLHRYVSRFDGLRGATLYSDGSPEYEALPDGTFAATLVRAVGQLSRADLPERPGHAGWPAETPAAQCQGPFRAALGVLLHGPRDDATVHHIEQVAADVLLPLAGHTIRAAHTVPGPTGGIELHGTGLTIGAVKPCDRGEGIVVRCVNLLDHEVEGRIDVSFPVSTAWFARLDETLLEPAVNSAGSISFRVRPRGVITLVLNDLPAGG